MVCTLYPGEKDSVNVRLARALVGTTRMYANNYHFSSGHAKLAGTSDSKINDAGVSTLDKLVAGDTQFRKRTGSKRSVLFSTAPEMDGLGRYRAVIREKIRVFTARIRVPFRLEV